MTDWVVVLLLAVFWGALGLIAAIVGREVWWQVLAAVEGIREWRAERQKIDPYACPGCGAEPRGGGEKWCQQCIDESNADYGPENFIPDGDDEWADELHAINQELRALPGPADGDPGNPPRSLVGGRAGEFGDLTRPIAHLTHYEVEAVIAQLRVPDWLPAYRLAA